MSASQATQSDIGLILGKKEVRIVRDKRIPDRKTILCKIPVVQETKEELEEELMES